MIRKFSPHYFAHCLFFFCSLALNKKFIRRLRLGPKLWTFFDVNQLLHSPSNNQTQQRNGSVLLKLCAFAGNGGGNSSHEDQHTVSKAHLHMIKGNRAPQNNNTWGEPFLVTGEDLVHSFGEILDNIRSPLHLEGIPPTPTSFIFPDLNQIDTKLADTAGAKGSISERADSPPAFSAVAIDGRAGDCSAKPVIVDGRQVPTLRRFLIRPQMFEMSVCGGVCSDRPSPQRHTFQSLLTELLSSAKEENDSLPRASGKCCMPTSYKPFVMLILGPHRNLHVRTERMVATCGCRDNANES